MAHEQRLLYLSAVGGVVTAWVPHGTITSGTRARDAIAPAPPDWVRFEDPVEHAFTLAVPKGWAGRGGLTRMGYSDHRPVVDLTSPDGRINVRFGDAAVPIYFMPDNLHRVGDIYDLG